MQDPCQYWLLRRSTEFQDLFSPTGVCCCIDDELTCLNRSVAWAPTVWRKLPHWRRISTQIVCSRHPRGYAVSFRFPPRSPPTGSLMLHRWWTRLFESICCLSFNYLMQTASLTANLNTYYLFTPSARLCSKFSFSSSLSLSLYSTTQRCHHPSH